MTARSAPTGTVSSSPTRTSWSTPATGLGISVSTLSVETSNSGSSTATVSPTCFSQRVTVPSVTDSPRAGMVTRSDMGCALLRQAYGRSCGAAGVRWCGRCDAPPRSGGTPRSGVDVQWLAGEREVRLTDRLGLRRVRVDELGALLGERLPVDDQRGLAD